MKKLFLVPVLVGVLTMSMPVFASSPVAQQALKPVETVSNGDALTAAQSQEVAAEAAELVKSGAVATPAAAQAIATSLVRMNDAKDLTTKAITAEAKKIYASYSPEMKALVDAAAAARGLTVEELIGNFLRTDADGSRAIAWNANTCMSAIDGKAGNVWVELFRTTEAVTKSAVAEVGGKGKYLGVFDFKLHGGKTFKSLDTAVNVQGVKAGDQIGARQFYDGAWHEIAVVGVKKNAVGLHITHVGPIVLYTK